VPIELWDSGLPIRTEEGDTVRSVAAKFAVPVWSLAQLNNIEPNATLRGGQRLVVPRNIEAISPAAGPLTSFAPRDH
jgi:LysM repeat protein